MVNLIFKVRKKSMQLLLVKIGGNTLQILMVLVYFFLNSSVPSDIKYAKIINSNVTQNWLLSAQDGSTIENSEFSGGAYGVTLSNNSTITNSKIYNFKYNGLELNNATATGNIIYDINNNSDTDSGGSDVNLHIIRHFLIINYTRLQKEMIMLLSG